MDSSHFQIEKKTPNWSEAYDAVAAAGFPGALPGWRLWGPLSLTLQLLRYLRIQLFLAQYYASVMSFQESPGCVRLLLNQMKGYFQRH